jgi:hypothetical protein
LSAVRLESSWLYEAMHTVSPLVTGATFLLGGGEGIQLGLQVAALLLDADDTVIRNLLTSIIAVFFALHPARAVRRRRE